MSIKFINGILIYDIFISGAKHIIEGEQNLNEINVFPIADGDTGTNLALTMKNILLQSQKKQRVDDTLNSISEVAIENAYGNSGMIFAEYLNGFAIESREKNHLTVSEFADIAYKASQYAYNAVSEPHEGTMLSIMRDWALDLKSNLPDTDFANLLRQSVITTRQLVEETKFKIKVLMESNVVDAGAKGFLLFIEGISSFVNGNQPIDIKALTEEYSFKAHENPLLDPALISERYCCQFYIETDTPLDHIKSTLKPLGTSLITTQTQNKTKIHIHTNSPEQLVKTVLNFGYIHNQKIEDMVLQNSLVFNKKHDIAIVTDSIADLPREWLDQEHISVIPINLICNSVVYLDKVTITPDTFYTEMQDYRLHPTSSQPLIDTFKKVYTDLLNNYDFIIGIFVSAKMSGTYKNAETATRKIPNAFGRVFNVDSKQNSSAEGLLVMEAARMRNEGYKVGEIVKGLENLRQNIHIYVSIDDLSSMIKGGRISKRKGHILNMLRIKPIASIDKQGNGIVFGKAFSQSKAIEKMISKLTKDFNQTGIKHYSIVYSNSTSQVNYLKDKIYEQTGLEPIFIEPISPVIGLNAGKNAIAVSYLKEG